MRYCLRALPFLAIGTISGKHATHLVHRALLRVGHPTRIVVERCGRIAVTKYRRDRYYVYARGERVGRERVSKVMEVGDKTLDTLDTGDGDE